MEMLTAFERAGVPARTFSLEPRPTFEPDPSALFLVFMKETDRQDNKRWQAVGLWRIRRFFDFNIVEVAALNKFLSPFIEQEKRRLKATRIETLKPDEIEAIIDGRAKGYVAVDLRETDFSQVSYTEIGK